MVSKNNSHLRVCYSLFLDIAEWSFQYLQQKAQLRREEIIEQKVEERVKENQRINHNVPNGSINNLVEANQSDDRSTITSELEEVFESASLATIPCTYNHHSGELTILPSGLAFNQISSIHLSQRNPRVKEIWQRPFLDLAEMRKVKPSNHKQDLLSKKDKLISAKKQKPGIEFLFTDGKILTVEMKEAKTRDQTFNLIIGHSGWRWM